MLSNKETKFINFCKEGKLTEAQEYYSNSKTSYVSSNKNPAKILVIIVQYLFKFVPGFFNYHKYMTFRNLEIICNLN